MPDYEINTFAELCQRIIDSDGKGVENLVAVTSPGAFACTIKIEGDGSHRFRQWSYTWSTEGRSYYCAFGPHVDQSDNVQTCSTIWSTFLSAETCSIFLLF